MNRNSSAIFLTALVVISLLYGYHRIIELPPYSIHQWRQTDGLSIALNYYKEGMNFFEPKMHFNYSEGGKGVGEFPIIYYIDALIWKITGQSSFAARLVNLLLSFSGFIILYKAIYKIINYRFPAIIIPLFIFSSPLIAFYSNNFLVNVPALSLIFICWYFFVRYYTDKKLRYLALFAFFATMSVLLRSTMFIGVVPVFILFFLEKIGYFKKKIFVNDFRLEGLLLLTPCIFLFIWLLFIRNYNASSNSVYFLTTIRPVWELGKEEILKTWHMFTGNIMFTIYNPGILFIIGISIILMLLVITKLNRYLVVFNISILISLLLYMLLWYANLDVHDYYLIELFLLIPPLYLSLVIFFKKYLTIIFNSWITKTLILLILIFSVGDSTVKVRLKYNLTDSFVSQMLLSEREIDKWDWYHWDYESKFRAYETIKPYLRSIGIKRDDIVVSIPDQSPNISLYFMDQKGFTSLYQEGKSIKEQLDCFIGRNAEYLIINDTTLYQKEEFSEYLKKKIGSYKNIEIFKLQE